MNFKIWFQIPYVIIKQNLSVERNILWKWIFHWESALINWNNVLPDFGDSLSSPIYSSLCVATVCGAAAVWKTTDKHSEGILTGLIHDFPKTNSSKAISHIHLDLRTRSILRFPRMCSSPSALIYAINFCFCHRPK